ncbi:hypothetical protein VTL71DRAFT_7723 [Oculimacula yallundae]|uniref:Secreted protein n=1 Tax=Oculimacula yallundae TaxID=86028 RepID=A0ABR4BUY0_9HELO
MVYISRSTLGICALVSSVAASNPNEIFYLANCSPCVITDNNCKFTRSTIAYYPKQSASENGEYPADIVQSSTVIAWEGITVSGLFSTTDTFSATIRSDAKPKKLYELVGTGSTSKHAFNCYHDQNRILYKDGKDYCYPQYYCQS